MGATPAALARLPDGTRLAALHFLLDWGAVQDALAVLSLVGTDAGDESHLLAATALRRAGRTGEALEVITALVKRSTTPAAELEMGRILLACHRTGEALARAQLLAGKAPTALAGWQLQGEIHLSLGDTGSADLAFSMAQRQNPADALPLLGRVRTALAAGDALSVQALLGEVAALPGGVEMLDNESLQLLRSIVDHVGAPVSEIDAPAINALLVRRFDRDLARIQKTISHVSTTPQSQPAAPKPQRNRKPEIDDSPPVAPARQGLPTVSRRELAEIQNGARTLFGHATLLPLQAEVIAATRRGEDVLAVLPTGGGKSLCYQLPAWLDAGTSLVISPLLALMKDQVDNLPPRLRTQAVALTGALQGDELKAALAGIKEGKYRLVFTAPERLRNRSLVATLRDVPVTRLVIDEAHCVSVWGHDFRPDYLHLARAHADLGAPPILALTATAPPPVRTDIVRQLFDGTRSGRPFHEVVGNPERPNLWLGAAVMRDDAQREDRIASLCHTLPGSGIVYVRSRARADSLAALLRERGIDAAPYHAGIGHREQVQERFSSGALRIVVATVAFGMGVDKRNIRFVVHAGLPESLDAYLQEIGRAGRDGEPAICMAYYTDRDLDAHGHFAQRESVDTTLLLRLHEAIGRAATESGARMVTVRLDQMAQDLRVEETALRVALSTLEEAGLVDRDYDVPRMVSLYLRKASKGVAFQRFVQAAGVQPGAPAQWAWLDLAAAVRVAPDKLEERLIEWQKAGFLNYYGSGREMLLHLRAARSDPAARLEALVSRRVKARQQRAADVLRFVQSGRCRHALLAEYSGAAAAERCNWCDNCGVALTSLLVRPSHG